MKTQAYALFLDTDDQRRVVESGGRLESVDITPEFRRRRARPANHEAENRALTALTEEMANAPRNVCQKLVEIALELCRAHSAGISILEEDSGRKNFRWNAVAGQWARYANGTMPREVSPCGTVLDRNTSLVLSHPEQFYPIPPEVVPTVAEVLLIPFRVAGEPIGTLWVVAHDESRKFDAEDERVMTNLGKFASTAYQFVGSLVAVKRQSAERERADEILHESERRFRQMIDALPAAIYTTDAEGRLTHFNPAAVEFSGHTPEIGTDKWCVSWKLFHADGTPMPREKCPMAIAMTEGRIVRGVEAIVERPDGKRLWFTPYPTPLRDTEGRIVGGINMLVDITERKLAETATASLAAIVDSSDDAIVGKSLDGIITSWNKSAERLFGYTVEEAIGQPVTMLIPTERQQEEPEILARLKRGIRVEHFETVRLRKNGSRLDISLTISPIKDAKGHVVGASKIVRDITERKQAEQLLELRAAQDHAMFQFAVRANRARKAEEICEAAMDAIMAGFSCDRAAILFADTEGVMRFTGWRGVSEKYRLAVEGHSPWRHDDPDPQPISIPDVAKAQIDEPIRRALQAEKIAAVAFIPIRDHERLVGKFMVYCSKPREFKTEELHLCQTIATTLAWAIERKRSEESLEGLVQERTTKLEETIAELEGFSYSITHDLRAPLRALQGFSHMLREGYGEKLDNEANDYLRRIGSSADRMDKLIQDVLVYSRVLRMDLPLKRVDTEKLLRGILESYPDFQEPKADIKIEGELPDVLAIEAALIQCFSNLLDNAIKFVPSGTKPQVRIGAERRGERVRFWVEDNGIGIDAKYFESIFGTFHRLTTAYEGTGIGLTIVRKATARMGGAVGVQSEPGKGSRFWFELREAKNNEEIREPAADSVH